MRASPARDGEQRRVLLQEKSYKPLLLSAPQVSPPLPPPRCDLSAAPGGSAVAAQLRAARQNARKDGVSERRGRGRLTTDGISSAKKINTSIGASSD
ncbi:hypothetical protein AAFF_G00151360 [Aldrovandia affinis]|uniref:Uncharacterized protein n=1 Tax=Aldrovandia affinis TaxID=143900 RepID=A0AAD7W8V0_9TELE|nr:hypothetical protein AAFF_G00151360 [Aldrovandia affinis]